MRTNTIVKKRTFSLNEITEEEGLILRTLLNLSEKGVEEKLMSDELYWNDDISKEVAIKIGVELVDKIMKMVDEK